MIASYTGSHFPRRELSLQERENLYGDPTVNFTGFSPRPKSSIGVPKTNPSAMKKIEVQHRVRTPASESTIIYPLHTYQTWVDVGDIEPIPIKQPDPEYNSNVWRNFSKSEGITCNVKGRATPALIAAMYPIPIPPASRMGDFTYDKFIKYGDVIKSDEAKRKKIVETKRRVEEMKRLEIMTAGRIPPTDMSGKIIAPLQLRRLQAQGRIKHRPLPSDAREQPRVGLLFDPQQSGPASVVSSTALRHKGLLWKFSYKMNNPAYSKVVNEQMDLQRWRENNARMRRLRRHNMAQQFVTSYT